MRSAVTLLMLCAALLLGAATAHAKVPKDFVGVQDDYLISADASYRTTNLSTMAALGVGTVREPFLWRDIERTPGTLDLTTYDQLVSDVSAHGLKILGVIFGPPQGLMQPGPSKYTCPPKSNEQFAGYAAALAARYGTKGSFWDEHPDVPRNPITTWQIWNEPNIRPYWCGKPNARQYVQLLAAASRGLKEKDPHAEVVTAGIPQSKLGIPLLSYIRQMYKAGAKGTFDTLAINPYSRTVSDLRKRLRDVRNVLNRNHDRTARIWITELAWSDVGPGSAFRVGAKGQGSRIRSAYRLLGQLRTRYRLRGAIYVYWRDLGPYPPRFKDFWGLHTGLLRKDGTPKSAFYEFKKAIAALR
jgi:hypothetical protein